MAYSESVLRAAEARLAAERQQHDDQNRARIAAIYEAQPRLREIDSQLRKTSARVMAACFRKGEDTQQAIEQLKKENLALQQERAWILESNELSPDDLADTPICPDCGGTGYVGAVMCGCLRELCRQEQKKELSAILGGKERFEHFRLDVYPDTVDPALGVSPRTLMQCILQSAQHYARTFSPASGSILMLGATGLGKTYLSACIARVVADRGFSVTYETAIRAFADFESARFGSRAEDAPDPTRRYFACDLLILDDLGTEMTTQFTVSALYQIVNTRLLENKATILSTNLPAAELDRRYGAQTASRLLGSYELYQFRGNDIRRMQK